MPCPFLSICSWLPKTISKKVLVQHLDTKRWTHLWKLVLNVTVVMMQCIWSGRTKETFRIYSRRCWFWKRISTYPTLSQQWCHERRTLINYQCPSSHAHAQSFLQFHRVLRHGLLPFSFKLERGWSMMDGWMHLVGIPYSELSIQHSLICETL